MNNHKERMIVTHFWNPPQFIPLVEIVPGEKTSIKTVNETEKFIKYLNKMPVRMNKECPGFIGNRLQLALIREALYIVEQGGANPEEVDKAVEYGFSRRLPASGPLASADLGGFDMFNNISKYLFKELCDYSEGSNILNDLVKQGKVGTKSGEGIYNWDERQIELIETKRNELLLYLFDK